MRTIRTLVIAGAMAAMATSAMARHRGAQLGMAFRDALALYPSAKSIARSEAGPARLELTDLDYAGAHWVTVDLIFDRSGTLDRIQFVTRDQSFQALKAQVVAQLNQDFAPQHGRMLMAGPAPSLQVRICDRGPAGVFLTYERPNQAA